MVAIDSKEMCASNNFSCNFQPQTSHCHFRSGSLSIVLGMALILNHYKSEIFLADIKGLINISSSCKLWSPKIPMSEGYFEPL